MTRFARAKGSKSNNERVPESATPWRDMKNHIVKNVDQMETLNINLHAIKSTLKATETHAAKWSEFPIMEQNVTVKTKKSTKNNQPAEGSVEEKSRNRKIKVKKTKSDQNKTDTGETGKHKQSKSKHKLIETKDSTGEKLKSNLKKQKIDESPTNVTKAPKPVINKIFQNEKHDLCNIRETGKAYKNTDYKRRKPNSELNKMFINGTEVEIAYYDGFPIKKQDAIRLKDLKKQMISKGIPRSEVAAALKLERRRAEKALTREKKKVCFNCRQSGHNLSECPKLQSGTDVQLTETGICFKCGSTEHTHFECKVTRGDNFKFAQCFICKEQGHIARQCPDNNKGLYPNGGACKICGAVTHLKKDCMQYQAEQEESKIVAHTINDQNIESLEHDTIRFKKEIKSSQKVIKF